MHEAGGGADKEIVARIFVAPTDDADTVRGMGRFAIAAYLNVPVYAAFHDWLGRGERLGDDVAACGRRATARPRSPPSPTRSSTS